MQYLNSPLSKQYPEAWHIFVNTNDDAIGYSNTDIITSDDDGYYNQGDIQNSNLFATII